TATLLSLGLGAWNSYRRWSSTLTQVRLLNQQMESKLSETRARLVEIRQAIASGNASKIGKQELEWGAQQTQWVNAYNPPTTVLPVAPLAFLATGRSDILPRSYKSSPWRGVEPNAPTTDDPVALLIGDFDLKLVVLAILPLILVLSCFDLLASEREVGTLRLILSQPVSFRKLLLCRAAVRGSLVVGSLLITIVALASAVHLAGGAIWIGRLAAYTAVSIGYLCLWVVIPICVNLLGRSGTANSVLLGGSWLAMVVVIPGITPVMAEALAPTPSRALYIDLERAARLKVYNGIRPGASSPSADYREAILAAFLKRHPEWASDPSLLRRTLFYAAQGEEHTAMLAAITNDFDIARERQQRTIGWLSILSFTGTTDRILTGLSGNSDARQAAFLEQSNDFFARSKRYFWPSIFRWDPFTPERFADIPR
ncbi:MAG: ABC transporter permease subunit, partial [Acidobacteria bacterium]|nr:ABC transporter permease subunit [Acidobacteriota bacterium]